MAHNYNVGAGVGSSGLAERLGDDFIVTLGFFGTTGTPYHRAGAFAHELGHNLGLTHSGDQDVSEVGTLKVNYPSVMSYRHQLASVRNRLICEGVTSECIPHKLLDYSHGLMPDLDETALDERLGVGYGPVDWNGNGVIDTMPVAFDLAGYPNVGGSNLQMNTDYDDWSNIIDVTSTHHRIALEAREEVSCLPLSEFEQTQTLGRGAFSTSCILDTILPIEPCAYPFDDPDNDGLGTGCDNCPTNYNPFQTDSDENGVGEVCVTCCDIPGDFTDDGSFNIGDVTAGISFIFSGGPGPTCSDEGDFTGDDVFNIADVTAGISFIFSSGPGPVCGSTGI